MKMKDKKAVQIKAKKRHNDEINAAKARRRAEPVLAREEATKVEKPTILIVCEGKNTEPSYFRQFKLSSATIKAVGNGHNTVSLVNQAIALSQRKGYDQVWCVFDKDKFAAQDFNNAIHMAEANNFGVAYSNQAFEYWLILHFEDHQGGGMHRDEYAKSLNEYLKPFKVMYEGDGSKIVSESVFELLEGVEEKTNKRRVELAIARAERNYNQFPHDSPATEESSTTVFKLVQEILKFV